MQSVMPTPKKRGRPLKVTTHHTDAVARVRAAMGLTQEEFAREMNCSIATVRRYEQEEVLPGGIAQKRSLARLAKRVNIDVSAPIPTQTK